jgi:hypothetical protein
MKTSQRAPLLLAALLLTFCMADGSSAQTGQFKLEPTALNFGAHDIGTTSQLALTVTNDGSAPANLTIVLTGNDPGEFSWNNVCLSNIPPHAKCNVTVLFAPLKITKEESREAQLVISGDKGESQTVRLSGSAYQNLAVSPGQLRFQDQLVDKPGSPLTLVVTNYSDATLSAITVSSTGDFTETHSKCEKVAPGASCAISVAFSPKAQGATTGSLTISADRSTLGKVPRLVLLEGKGFAQCNLVPISIWSKSLWLAFLVGGLYFAGLVLVRWHMIAKPARAQLVTQIQAVRSSLRAETAGNTGTPAVDTRIARIDYLLDWALYPFKYPKFPIEKDPNGKEISCFPGCLPWSTRLFNAVFWPRGQELAGWSASHEAELLLVELLPAEHVRARMETAEQRLRELKTPAATSLADLLHTATNSPASPVPLDRWRALLAEGLAAFYEHRDKGFFELATWHSKMMWLVGCALLLIFALAATLQNAILLLLGAVGGLLSRLARTVSSADTANDYGATWGALFLSPLSGALSAWGGVLLIVLGFKFNILGTALNADWCNPYEPATLAIALLFGFSERLFDGIATQIDEKIAKTQPPSPTSPRTSPAPAVNTPDPAKASPKQGPLPPIGGLAPGPERES